jgi:hypothetical protein
MLVTPGAMIRRLAFLILAVCLETTETAEASEPAVPFELQADLIAKLVKYDRNFLARAGDPVEVLLVYRAKNPDSESAARRMRAALQMVPLLGGVKHEEQLAIFSGADALVAHAKQTRSTLIIVGPGFDDVIPHIAAAFDGFDGLTLSTTENGAEHGIVLGFELVSGKPRILLNLAQARHQNADFKSEAMKVMKVIQ